MKCIKISVVKFGIKTDGATMVVRRVGDTVAFNLVHNGEWMYAPRSEWKAAGRKYGMGP